MTVILGTYGGKEIRIDDEGFVYSPASAFHRHIAIAAMGLVVEQHRTGWRIVKNISPESQPFWDIFETCLSLTKNSRNCI
jgi:hypothetical protein